MQRLDGYRSKCWLFLPLHLTRICIRFAISEITNNFSGQDTKYAMSAVLPPS
jgi:hypothetical protein